MLNDAHQLVRRYLGPSCMAGLKCNCLRRSIMANGCHGRESRTNHQQVTRLGSCLISRPVSVSINSRLITPYCLRQTWHVKCCLEKNTLFVLYGITGTSISYFIFFLLDSVKNYVQLPAYGNVHMCSPILLDVWNRPTPQLVIVASAYPSRCCAFNARGARSETFQDLIGRPQTFHAGT